MNDETLIANRLCELAVRAYNNNYYTYTEFLGLAEQSALHRLAGSDSRMKGIIYSEYGGIENAERVIAAFGNSGDMGYEPEYPITCIKVCPVNRKFADKLSHRDFLGAVMNLGIEREQIGDIYITDNTGYIFCLEKMAEYITDNLNQIRHTQVLCAVTDERPDIRKDVKEITVQIPSERIDAVTARAYKLSRSSVSKLITQNKLFINGSQCESVSVQLKAGDVVSVRGYGRYEYMGVDRKTVKGNFISIIRVY